MQRLPHRYPLLLLDRVIELQHDVKIVALKNVTINEEFFQGHFPGLPVMPGVLILEAMAQAGGLMVLPEDGSAAGKNFFLVSIDQAKFRRTVVPGDQLRVTVTLAKARANFRKLAGRAEVDGQLVAEAELTLTGVDPA
jgi:beta-hydroxyacyl-ACP dehydratase FabZ